MCKHFTGAGYCENECSLSEHLLPFNVSIIGYIIRLLMMTKQTTTLVEPYNYVCVPSTVIVLQLYYVRFSIQISLTVAKFRMLNVNISSL